MAKNRKADVFAQKKGTTAESLKTERQRRAARLEEITGIKQPIRVAQNKRKKRPRKAKNGPTFE